MGGKHGSVGRGFVPIGLDFHSTSDTYESFPSREIGNVDEGIVEGGEEMGHGEDFFALDEVGYSSGTVEASG